MFYSLDNFYVPLISYKNRLELQKNDPNGRRIYIYEAGQGDRVWWQINWFFFRIYWVAFAQRICRHKMEQMGWGVLVLTIPDVIVKSH